MQRGGERERGRDAERGKRRGRRGRREEEPRIYTNSLEGHYNYERGVGIDIEGNACRRKFEIYTKSKANI